MGRPHLPKSISSTSTARPASARGSSAPSLSSHRSRFVKKLLLRTTGFLAIVSLVGISTAAEPGDSKQKSPNQDSQKTTSINLDSNDDKAPPKASSSVDSVTTGNTTVVSGSASNTNGTSYSVTVNGQPVDVPANGNSQQTITTPDGTTTNISVNNSTSNQGSNFSATSTMTNSSSQHTSINQDIVTEHKFGSP